MKVDLNPLEENNLLQIAINKGSAKTLLGLKIHELVRVDFK